MQKDRKAPGEEFKRRIAGAQKLAQLFSSRRA
jgi:hypothetical protein